MFIIGILLTSVIGYLIGSISFSTMITKKKSNVDLKTVGSKSTGATNASRVLGKKWGIIILFLDISKIIIASVIAFLFSLIGNEIFSQTSFFIPALFALLGHCYSIYYKFKGGKAVSCLIGMLFITNWVLIVGFAIVWWGLIFIFRKVSVSSIFASLTVMILVWIPQVSFINNNYEWIFGDYLAYNGYNFFTAVSESAAVGRDWTNALYFNALHNLSPHSFYDSLFVIQIIITIGILLLLFKHRTNIQRIFKGTEPTFFEYKKKTSKKNILKT